MVRMMEAQQGQPLLHKPDSEPLLTQNQFYPVSESQAPFPNANICSTKNLFTLP